uniref:Uncharacterized protein n=1 Tax=Dulem virus 79 TaxID=3145790 RepID=A0AAU8B751_9VIRU
MHSKIDEFGREIFSGEQVALPIHFTRKKSIHEQLRDMILAMKHVEREGYETFEDADDFDVDDFHEDFQDLPSYEADFDHLPEVETPKDESKTEPKTEQEPAPEPKTE